MDVDLKHPCFLSLCDWASSIPKRSPLPLLSFLCPVTTILPTNDTRFNGKLLQDWKLYWTFQLHPACSMYISANLYIFPSFWKCLPTTIVPFQGKGRSKENKKGSFFGFAGLLVAVSRCRPLKWVHERKVSVITDSSHHEALWGLAPECWEGQNGMHQVCNYLAKINTFFTEFYSFPQCWLNYNGLLRNMTAEWVKLKLKSMCASCLHLGVCFDFFRSKLYLPKRRDFLSSFSYRL